jgi:uncharacterized protein
MVEINVSQLLKSSIGTIRTYDVDDLVQIGDEQPLVQGTVTLLRTNRGILVTGQLRASVRLTCSRCLSQFEHPVTLRLEEEFFPTIDILTGAAVGVPDDDPGSFTVDENNVIDLSEAIRQYALMAVPMKPLCRKDCPGLCPTCGANLREGQCGCPPQVDPRWSGLLANNPNK